MLKSVKYLTSLLTVALLGLLELSNSSFFFGIKPNFVLALSLAFSRVEKSWLKRLLLVLVGAFSLKFYPAVDIHNIAFAIVTFLAIVLIDYLPWRESLNIVATVALATFFLNISGFSYKVFLIETFYNVVLTAAFWGLIKKLYDGKE